MSTVSDTSEQLAVDVPRLRQRAIGVVVLAALLLSLLLAVAPLRRMLGAIGHMGAGWICLAVALEIASCCSFVVVFRLFFDRVPREAGRELAWTVMGAGSLLPGGGVGALAVGGWLLHQAGMSRSDILRRSSALFLLTSAASVGVMIAVGGLLFTSAVSGPHDALRAGAPMLVGSVVIALVLAAPVAWRRSNRVSEEGWLGDLVGGIAAAVRSLTRPSWRLLGAIGYLVFDIGVLWATFAAAGREPPLAALVLGYIIGYLANVLPVPGGVGVLDAGLAGTLIVYGAHPSQAAVAVLVYHAIAFWIPSLGGVYAYTLVRRRITVATTAIDDAVDTTPLLPERWEPSVVRAARV
jgi:uncharacterized membrane protein YbhN (UPF0104 family)